MEIWAIDYNWCIKAEFNNFNEANSYWINKPSGVIQILYKKSYNMPVHVFKSI